MTQHVPALVGVSRPNTGNAVAGLRRQKGTDTMTAGRMQKVDSAVREILGDAFARVGLDSYATVAREFPGSEMGNPGFYESVPKFVDWLMCGATKHFELTDNRRTMLSEIGVRINNACFDALENDENSDADMDEDLEVARKAADCLR